MIRTVDCIMIDIDTALLAELFNQTFDGVWWHDVIQLAGEKKPRCRAGG